MKNVVKYFLLTNVRGVYTEDRVIFVYLSVRTRVKQMSIWIFEVKFDLWTMDIIVFVKYRVT